MVASASIASAKKQGLERIRRMTVRQRMLLALELGRRGRMIQQRAQKSRSADRPS